MHLSIRDLLWATALVAMGLGWWVSDRATEANLVEAIRQTHRHRTVLAAAKKSPDLFFNASDPKWRAEHEWPSPIGWTPDWTILDEPLVEPKWAAVL